MCANLLTAEMGFIPNNPNKKGLVRVELGTTPDANISITCMSAFGYSRRSPALKPLDDSPANGAMVNRFRFVFATALPAMMTLNVIIRIRSLTYASP